MKNTLRCLLGQVTYCGGDVYQVVLHPEEPVNFKAGQYLQVIMANNDKRPFSIASAPEVKDRIELHIGASTQNTYSLEVLERLKERGYIDVELPLGNAYFRESERPLLFLIGGTGFSYAHSIIEHCINQKLTLPITLYWGVRKHEFMYARATVSRWAEAYKQIDFVPVVQYPDASWSGQTGMVHQVLLEQHPDLSAYDIYIAGRFEMAKAAKVDFVAAGADPFHIYGDAF